MSNLGDRKRKSNKFLISHYKSINKYAISQWFLKWSSYIRYLTSNEHTDIFKKLQEAFVRK